MKLVLHTVICCCIFSTVMPLDKGAGEELNTSLKKRFRVWLLSRMKRDGHGSLAPATEGQPGNTVSPPPSLELNVRPRRSTSSKSTGCHFITCSYHDLLHRLHENSKVKCEAPKEKLKATGYGRRRRRSLQEASQRILHTGRAEGEREAGSERRSAEAEQPPCRH